MPSKKLWAYIARLEKVIRSTMESSDEISDLVTKIQQEGVEVSLNCIALFSDSQGRSFTTPEAGRAFRTAQRKSRSSSKKTTKTGAKPASPERKEKARAKHRPEFRVTDADREFLKQIGIRFD